MIIGFSAVGVLVMIALFRWKKKKLQNLDTKTTNPTVLATKINRETNLCAAFNVELRDNLCLEHTAADFANAENRFQASVDIHQSLNEANLALERGEIESAIDLFKKTVALFPEHPTAYLKASALLCKIARQSDAEVVLSAAIRKFPNLMTVNMQHAQMLQSKGDVNAALFHWENFYKRFPDVHFGFLGAAQCLRTLNLFNDAEALLDTSLQQFPGEISLILNHARMAELRSDWQEALKRWLAFIDRFPHQSTGFIGAAVSSRHLGKLNDAEALSTQAIKQFPTDSAAAIEHARIAEGRADWEAAFDRWNSVCNRFPENAIGYLGAAAALRYLDRLEEANAVLSRAAERFPAEPVLAIEYARLAQLRKSWAEAVRRWETVRKRFPDKVTAYIEASRALRELDRYTEAEAVLIIAIKLFPNELSPLNDYAHIATIRKDWQVSLLRWKQVIDRFPDQVDSYLRLTEANKQMLCFEAAEAVLKTAMIKFPNSDALRQQYFDLASQNGDLNERILSNYLESEKWFQAHFPHWNERDKHLHLHDMSRLLSRFESIGLSCQFGFVQREYNCEPISLMRWGGTSARKIHSLIATGWADIDDPSKMNCQYRTDLGHFLIVIDRHQLVFHTTETNSSACEKKLLVKHSRIIKYLVEKLRSDLENAEKYFTLFLDEHKVSRQFALDIESLLVNYNPNNRLLLVLTVPEREMWGNVSVLSNNLICGCVRPQNETPGTDGSNRPDWVSICQKAHVIWEMCAAKPFLATTELLVSTAASFREQNEF